jgi:multimeric flavodoxin WrbA
MEALDEADELHVVSPVYFAGPPSQFKALLDRLQPHYWKNTRTLPKRPAYLHVVGEGGDPHGFEPLVTICRSALSVAGFTLETVTPYIGSTPAEEGSR